MLNDVILGYDMDTGLPKYNYETWAFTSRDDRARYTDFQLPGAEARDDYTGTEIEYCPGTSARNWELDTWNPNLGTDGLLFTYFNTSCRTQVVFEGEYVAGEGWTLQRGAGNPTKGNRWFGDGVPRERHRVHLGAAVECPVDGHPRRAAGERSGRRPDRVDRSVMSPAADMNISIMGTTTGLLFMGCRADGAFHAFDAATGEDPVDVQDGHRLLRFPGHLHA